MGKNQRASAGYLCTVYFIFILCFAAIHCVGRLHPATLNTYPVKAARFQCDPLRYLQPPLRHLTTPRAAARAVQKQAAPAQGYIGIRDALFLCILLYKVMKCL